MAGLLGLHHVALVSRDLARTADFYGRLIGLRDLGAAPAPLADPERPGAVDEATARWFGDGVGRAGSLLAVVERRDAAPGRPGVGGTHHLALAVADRFAVLASGEVVDRGDAGDAAAAARIERHMVV